MFPWQGAVFALLKVTKKQIIVADHLDVFIKTFARLHLFLIELFDRRNLLLLGHEDFLDDLFLLCDDLHLQIVVTTDLVSLAIFCGGDKLAILKVSLAPLEGLILLQNLFEIVVVVLPVVCKQLRIRCSNLLVFMVLNRVFRVCYYLLKFFDSIT